MGGRWKIRNSKFEIRNSKSEIARHDKDGCAFEAGVFGSEALGVVELADVHHLFAARHHLDGHVVVTAVADVDQPPRHPIQDEIHGEVAPAKPAAKKALAPKATTSMTVAERKKAAEAISKMKPAKKPATKI